MGMSAVSFVGRIGGIVVPFILDLVRRAYLSNIKSRAKFMRASRSDPGFFIGFQIL